jgi:hypothetical protein
VPPSRARREELRKLYTKFTTEFPIVTIEDPFDQDDWDNTAAFTAEGVCQVSAARQSRPFVFDLGGRWTRGRA